MPPPLPWAAAQPPPLPQSCERNRAIHPNSLPNPLAKVPASDPSGANRVENVEKRMRGWVGDKPGWRSSPDVNLSLPANVCCSPVCLVDIWLDVPNWIVLRGEQQLGEDGCRSATKGGWGGCIWPWCCRFSSRGRVSAMKLH